MGEGKILDDKEAALLVNTCITRNLQPAFSLEQGLDMIKAAVEELKANPPLCSSGMYRFQVLEVNDILLRFKRIICLFAV